MITRWDERFLALALHFAAWSKDKSTQVGSVIVGPDNEIRSSGFNGFPRGVNEDVWTRHERPEKYLWSSHAEENAVMNAARIGVSVRGCTLYLNSQPAKLLPCATCARAIIQSGIRRIVGFSPSGEATGRWDESSQVALQMLRESEVMLDLL